VKKKAAGPTATDQVLKIINRFKKGIDVPSLMKRTRFDERKVRNIIYRAFKSKKIKRVGRGMYAGA
jgi:Mor family transcriptional regulator